MIAYHEESASAQLAWRKLGQDMMADVQRVRRIGPGDQPKATSIYGAMAIPFICLENFEAVVYYNDGPNKWWADIVFRKGDDDYVQIGIPTASPCPTKTAALSVVKKMLECLASL